MTTKLYIAADVETSRSLWSQRSRCALAQNVLKRSKNAARTLGILLPSWRLIGLCDAKIRHAQRWYYQMGRRVWFHEVFGFLFRDRRLKAGPSVEEFWGATLEHEEEALARLGRRTQLLPRPLESAAPPQ